MPFVLNSSSRKRYLSDALRIIISLWLLFALFLAGIFLVFVPSLKTHMMNQKKDMLVKLTDSTISLLSEYQERYASGELSLSMAKARARERIRGLRYGVEAKDYFWVQDSTPVMIMHPYFRDLEGRNLSNYKDPSGNRLFVQCVEVVRKHGSGFVSYMWPYHDDANRIVPKISFVKAFKPWDWIIGTGIYTEDVQKEISVITQNLIRIFMGLLVVLSLLSIYITVQAINLQKKRYVAEKAQCLDELRLNKLLELNQMDGATTAELTEFALQQAISLTQSDIGYLFFVDQDENGMTLQSWSEKVMQQCEMSDKKPSFRVEDSGLLSEPMRRREAVIANDYNSLPPELKRGLPTGHVKISRHLSIPVFEGRKIVALAGVANKNQDYDDADVRQLRLLMDGMWKILQREKALEALRESEERHRILAENASDNIWILDLETSRFSYISPSVTQMMGYTPEEMMSLELSDFMSEKSIALVSRTIEEELHNETISGTDPRRFRMLQLEQIRKNGDTITVEVTAGFLRDKTGRPDRILGITRNIAERIKMEQRLEHSQKMEAIGTLAGGIARET